MAVEKTILAKGSRGHHTFYLKVTETSIDIANNQSFLSYDFWLVMIITGSGRAKEPWYLIVSL